MQFKTIETIEVWAYSKRIGFIAGGQFYPVPGVTLSTKELEEIAQVTRKGFVKPYQERGPAISSGSDDPITRSDDAEHLRWNDRNEPWA